MEQHWKVGPCVEVYKIKGTVNEPWRKNTSFLCVNKIKSVIFTLQFLRKKENANKLFQIRNWKAGEKAAADGLYWKHVFLLWKYFTIIMWNIRKMHLVIYE